MGNSSSSSSSSAPKHACQVVIVGGGYGGIQLAVQLDSYCKVILVDPKDVFHHNVGALRAIVEPAFIKKTLIPYEETLKHGSFVKDRVVSCNISRKTVTLASGEEISYDFLVFACGSSVPFPGKRNILASGHVHLCELSCLQLGADLPKYKITVKFWHRLNQVD